MKKNESLVIVTRLFLILTLSLTFSFMKTAESRAASLNPGDIIIADAIASGSGAVIRVDPVTGTQTIISSGGSFIQTADVVIDSTGAILVAEPFAFGGAIIRVDPVTGAQTTISSGGSFRSPRKIAIDSTGDLIVVDVNAFGDTGGIIRVDPVTGAQTIISSGGSFAAPDDITIDSTGNLIVADDTGFIIRVDPVTGAQTIISSGGSFSNPRGVGIDSNGDFTVVDAFAFGGAVFRVDPATGTQTTLSSGGSFGRPVAIAIVGSTSSPISLAVEKTEIAFNNLLNTDSFRLKGELRLDAKSNGIDPINEPIGITLGTATLTIPSSSFVELLPGEFTFVGAIDSFIVDMIIQERSTGAFRFDAVVNGVDLTNTANPLDIKLTIGDDIGESNIRLGGALKFTAP